MKRPALIFDFGNVLAFFDFEKATARLGPRVGLTGRELLDRLRDVGFHSLHAEFERGELGAEVFSQRFAELIRMTVTHEEFAVAWADIFTANESIVPIVAELKRRGYRLILGSNTNSIHAERFKEQFATTLAYFDRLILSYEVGVMKPHREFYLACASAAEMAPEDCIFIDDLAENIAGAEAVGMRGIIYRSSDNLREHLQALTVELNPLDAA